MPSLRESVVRLAARGARWSGVLRFAQALSQRYEIVRSESGSFAALRRPSSAKFAIVCYHRVGSGGVPYYSSFDPGVFEAQMRFLRSAYRIVSLSDLCRELDDGGGRAGQAVALTFDDGYRDFYTHAFPILQRYGIPAMVYLVGSAIETGEVPWYDRIFALIMRCQRDSIQLADTAPTRFPLSSRASRLLAAQEIVRILRGYPNRARIQACAALERQSDLPESELRDRMLSWSQVREMRDFGISFGAHTMSHPVVSRLSPDEREFELRESKRLLETRLQGPVDHFAYPFGSVSDIDAATCSLMPRYGYKSAVSTVWGINTPSTPRYLLRRIGGEEPCLSLFAARLRWLFLNQELAPVEMQGLEQAAERASWQGRELGTEVKHA